MLSFESLKNQNEQPAAPPPGAKTPPIKPGEVFDPRKALHLLKEARISAKQSPEERAAARQELRGKLDYQKEGRVQMQGKLIEEIRKNPDLGLERLFQIAEEYSNKYGLSIEARILSRGAINDYARNHGNIMYYREKYPNNKDLYAAIFGVMPVGELEVIIEPMTLYLRCHDVRDYAWAYKSKFLEIKQGAPLPVLSQAEIDSANNSGGSSLEKCVAPGLEGIINLENTSRILRNFNMGPGGPAEIGKYESFSLKLRIHEEQHSFRRLFKNREIRGYKEKNFSSAIEAFNKANTDEEKENAIREYLVFERELDEHRYRDELLAYLKESLDVPGDVGMGELAGLFLKPKAQGGLYDFFGDKRSAVYDNLKSLSLDATKRDKLVEQVFVKEYGEILRNGIKAFIDLRESGYSPDAAVAHLISERVVSWPQVARRAIKHKIGE